MQQLPDYKVITDDVARTKAVEMLTGKTSISEPAASSEVRSHIARPSWYRLARAASSLLSHHIPQQEAEDVEDSVYAHLNSVGGGTQADFKRLIIHLLDAMRLPEKETGAVLISAFSYLQLADLPWSPRTWRALVFTATLASIRIMGSGSKDAEKFVCDAVVHWWPKESVDRAFRTFVCRPEFRKGSLTRTQMTECYFTLRERDLQMSEEKDASSSQPNSESLPRTPETPMTSSSIESSEDVSEPGIPDGRYIISL